MAVEADRRGETVFHAEHAALMVVGDVGTADASDTIGTGARLAKRSWEIG
jgi:hypothetical protein